MIIPLQAGGTGADDLFGNSLAILAGACLLLVPWRGVPGTASWRMVALEYLTSPVVPPGALVPAWCGGDPSVRRGGVATAISGVTRWRHPVGCGRPWAAAVGAVRAVAGVTIMNWWNMSEES